MWNLHLNVWNAGASITQKPYCAYYGYWNEKNKDKKEYVMRGQDCQRLMLNATTVSFHFMHTCCAIALLPHSFFQSVIILHFFCLFSSFTISRVWLDFLFVGELNLTHLSSLQSESHCLACALKA